MEYRVADATVKSLFNMCKLIQPSWGCPKIPDHYDERDTVIFLVAYIEAALIQQEVARKCATS